MTAIIDDRTPNLSLPLPNVLNIQTADVARLRSMLGTLDTLLYNLQTTVSGLPTLTAVNAAIQAVVGAAPSALDTLKELADAIGDDANFAATMTTALAGKLPNVTATPTRLGGIKVGAGLTVGDDGTISVPASGGGTGLPAYSDLVMTATTNGQTVFAPSGGYSVGMIDVYHNGVLLVGNGEDYTASNGTSFTLVQGINNTTDILLVRRWAYVPASIAVSKAGDTMNGNLTVPSLNGGQLAGMRNAIINGEMLIAQAGTSFALSANSVTYTLDQWAVYGNGAGVSVAQVAGPAGFKNALQVTGAAGNTQCGILQRIESINCVQLSGQTATISFNISASVAQTVGWSIYYPNAADNWSATTFISNGSFSVTTSASTYSVTVSLPAGVVNGLQITIYPQNGGAFTSGTLTLTGVQMEKGLQVTPFEHRSYGLELMLCQRYYQPIFYVNGYASSATTFSTALQLPVPMRASPTATPSAAITIQNYSFAGTTQSSLAGPTAVYYANGGLFLPSFQNFSGLTAGAVYTLITTVWLSSRL